MYRCDRGLHSCLPQLDLKTYIGTIEYTETEEEEKNVKVLDLVKAGEIAFSMSSPTAIAFAACLAYQVWLPSRALHVSLRCLMSLLR